MAVKFTSVKCPECGANLPIEEGREKIFCSYCGTPIIMTDENEYTYRHIDEAEVKRAETERLIRLKELEMEEKESERSHKGHRSAMIIAGLIAVIGIISEIVLPLNLIGTFLILVSLWIVNESQRKKKVRRILSSDEAQITEDMAGCRGKNYNAAMALFQSAGFSNVRGVALGDLSFFTAKKNGQVESVSIDGEDDFDEGDIFQRNANVIITYHSTR